MTPTEDAIMNFLERHECDLIYWRDGVVVIETYFEKLFVALGGNVDRLIALFEDYGSASDAARYYFTTRE